MCVVQSGSYRVFSLAKSVKEIRNNKLFIISEFVDKSRNSTGYYWCKIIKGISAVKTNTYVVSTQSSCDLITKNNASVRYIKVNDSYRYKKNNVMSRLFGQLLLSLLFTKAIAINVRRNDIIFSGTNPSLQLLFMAALKPIIRFKWVLLVHDVFPENLIAAKLIKDKVILYRLAKFIFDKVYSRADSLIAIGRDMQEVLLRKTRDTIPIDYIPNWVNLDEIIPKPRFVDNYFSGRDLSDKIVFQFFGNIGRVQGIECLLEAISKVRSWRASFLLIGNGAEESLVQEFIATHPDRDVVHVSNLPFEKNNDGLAACDIAIVSLAAGMKGLGVPSKAYFSMAADKPILVVADKGSELHTLLTENPNVGWFCPSGDPKLLATLIDRICSIDLRIYATKPRALMAEKYDYFYGIDKYLGVLDRLGSDVT